MIRPITCIGFILACASGFRLYETKHRVNVVDHEIAKVVHETGAASEQIRSLMAEWALLNEPNRLQRLANQLLVLKPSDQAQFTSLEDLDRSLSPDEPAPLPDATIVAGAESSADPLGNVVAPDKPALMEKAQFPSPTGTPASSPAEASPAPSASATIMSSASAPAATQPPGRDAEAVQLVANPTQLNQQNEAEAAGNGLPQASGDSASGHRALEPDDAWSSGSRPLLDRAIQTSGDSASGHRAVEPNDVRSSGSRHLLGSAIQTPGGSASGHRALESDDVRSSGSRHLLGSAIQTPGDSASGHRAPATPIEQQQKPVQAPRAQVPAARQTLPVPALSRPAVAGIQLSDQDAKLGRLPAEFAQLQQHREAEAAMNRRLQAQVDRLATQVEQQQKSLNALRAQASIAKQPLPLPAPAPPPVESRFNAAQSVVARLRMEQNQPREQPHDLLLGPVPAPAAPASTAQFWPRAHSSSPWHDLMDARAAIRAGDTYLSGQHLEAARAELLSQPSPRHYLAATQISLAVGLINAGENVPALYFLDLAIANAGGPVSYAAANMVRPPPQIYPPWDYPQ